jgi:hypothetical protein
MAGKFFSTDQRASGNARKPRERHRLLLFRLDLRIASRCPRRRNDGHSVRSRIRRRDHISITGGWRRDHPAWRPRQLLGMIRQGRLIVMWRSGSVLAGARRGRPQLIQLLGLRRLSLIQPIGRSLRQGRCRADRRHRDREEHIAPSRSFRHHRLLKDESSRLGGERRVQTKIKASTRAMIAKTTEINKT